MFEQEIEMERRTGSVVPLLLIVALIIAVVSVAGYYIVQNRQVLSVQEATQVGTSVLADQGPATFRFHTGLVKSSVNDDPTGPHYRLLEKAGLVKIGKAEGAYKTTYPIALTPAGEQLLKRIEGVTSATETDGTKVYVVPVAEQKLVSVSDIKMLSIARATFVLTWNWKTNALGDMLDAGGSDGQKF